MKTRRPLRYVIKRTGGRAGSGRRVSSAGTARAVLGRGLLVPAFVLVAIGTGAAALPGHGVHGAGQAPAHRKIAAHTARSCAVGRTSSSTATTVAITMRPQIPWMYAVFAGTPSATASKIPWMYAVFAGTPSATASKIPWMYGTSAVKVACRSAAAAGHTRV